MKTYESEIMFDKLNWVPENVTSARLNICAGSE